MVKVVNINKLVTKLEKAKCDFYSFDNNNNDVVLHGHTIEVVLQEIIDCIVNDDFNSWGRSSKDSINKIIDEIRNLALED